MVTVKHPESNKPKPTAKKSKPIQADLDVGKEFIKCKEEGLKRLDLSKSSVRELDLIYDILPGARGDVTMWFYALWLPSLR